MDLSDIVGLGAQVRSWAHKNCHLWLASPNAFVLDGTAQLVSRAWGFKPRQLLTWRKTWPKCGKERLGGGHWMRNSTEQILFCTRGTLPALKPKNVLTSVSGPVTRHSAKPQDLFDLVERVSPGPRLEMFAREARPGWDRWGDEAPAGRAKRIT